MTHEAFVKAVERSEQLITGAIFMRHDEETYQRWLDDATAIADEWDFSADLRIEIIESARQNYVVNNDTLLSELEQEGV